MTRFILVLLILSSVSVKAQQSENCQKYLKDFDYFIGNLIATHPDPFTAFGGKIRFYRAKQKARNEVKNVSSDNEFISLLNRFVSRLEDGHTYINRLPSAANTKTKYLPLRFKASSDRLFIQNTTEAYKSLVGKPIAEINGIPVDSLLDKVKSYFSSENISGNYFSLMYLINNSTSAQAFLGSKENKIKLTFCGDSKNKSIEIPYVDKVNWLIQKSALSLPQKNDWINFSMIGKNKEIAYFQWNKILCREFLEKVYQDNPQNIEKSLQWVYWNSSKNKRTGDVKKDITQVPALYEQFYLMLSEMQKSGSKYLIIDLRRNSGGMTPLLGPLLYMLYGDKYLNFDFNATYSVKISALLLRKYGVTLDQYNKIRHSDYVIGDYNTTVFGNSPGNTIAEKEKLEGNGYLGFGSDYVKKSRNLNIKAHIIILTSVHTFSAAYHFTYFLKKMGNATIIGVAPRQRGNTFMENTPIELPETKITGSISNSVQILFKKDREKGKILHPDIEMNWGTFRKYKFDKNAELLEALDFIKNTDPNSF